MIYFDKNKNGYDKASVVKFNIEPVCEVDDETVVQFFEGDPGEYWDIIDNKFVIYKEKRFNKMFKDEYIETSQGYVSREPKGFINIPQQFLSFNNIVASSGEFPEGMVELINPRPDFSNCNNREEYKQIVAANTIKNKAMGKEEFNKFYNEVITKYSKGK